MTAAVAAVSFAPVDAAAVGAPQAGDSLVGALSDTMAELIDAIVAADGMMASITAYRARLIDQARSLSELSARTTVPQRSASDRPGGWDAATVAHRELVTELACALRLPERSTETLVAQSALLATRLPSTLDALEKGEISYRHAQSIADHAASLPEETAGDFETAVLPAARTLTVARFERAARVQRERMHPESIEARHIASAVDRSVSVTPARDGMAWLSAYLPAADAIAIHNRLWDLAGSLTSKTGSLASKTGSLTGKTEQRTRTQLMSDVLVDLLVDGEIVSPTASTASAGESGRQ